MAVFYLKVLAPERHFFEGECEYLTIPTTDGEYGIMANHSNMIAAVIPGEVRITEPGKEPVTAAISNGIIKVENNKVTVLTESLEKPEEIDEINILNATKKCMKNAVEGLSITPDVVLIDAVELNLKVPTVSIIKGDLKSYTIGAASILAKVYRDKLMEEYAKQYPDYGFERNAGYGTKEHIDKIKEIGPCKIHRRTFIKNFWG